MYDFFFFNDSWEKIEIKKGNFFLEFEKKKKMEKKKKNKEEKKLNSLFHFLYFSQVIKNSY